MWCLMVCSDLCDSIIFCHFIQQCPDRSLQNKQCSVVRDRLLGSPAASQGLSLDLNPCAPSPVFIPLWPGWEQCSHRKGPDMGDTWPCYCRWHFSLCLRDVLTQTLIRLHFFFFQLNSRVICFRKKQKQQKDVMDKINWFLGGSFPSSE